MGKLDNFRYARFARNLNRVSQIVLAVLLVLALNYLAARNFARWDLTQSRKYSLAPETVAYIEGLEEPVRIIAAITPEDDEDIYRDLKRLLREYEYAGLRPDGVNKVEVEFPDLYQDRFRAQELREKYGLNELPGILLISGDRHRLVDGTRLYEIGPDGEPTAFRGEQLFTSAILDVARTEKDIVYFLTGHGEMGMGDVGGARGLSNFSQYLKQRGIEVRPLELTMAAQVPDDADLIIVADPTGPLLRFEVEKLRRYMNDQRGRMLVLLSPGHQHGLGTLLNDWGILSQDMAVADAAPGAVTPEGKVLVRQFSPEHPITEILAVSKLRLVGNLFRPVGPDPGAPADERLQTTVLMASSDRSWGEANYQGSVIEFNEAADLPGPVPLATVGQRRAGSRMDINIPGGRMVVAGSGAIAANEHFSQPGNRLFLANSVNWLLDRNRLLNIPPKAIETMRLALTGEDLSALGKRFLAIPGAVALLGLLVYLLRRR